MASLRGKWRQRPGHSSPSGHLSRNRGKCRVLKFPCRNKQNLAPIECFLSAVLREADQYLANTYKRPKLVFTHGKGCTLYDHRGRAYLDFLGGIAVNALGYAHPRLSARFSVKPGALTHVSNLFHNPYQGPLATKLAKWSGLDRVFFTNSGAEAVETR